MLPLCSRTESMKAKKVLPDLLNPLSHVDFLTTLLHSKKLSGLLLLVTEGWFFFSLVFVIIFQSSEHNFLWTDFHSLEFTGECAGKLCCSEN